MRDGESTSAGTVRVKVQRFAADGDPGSVI